MLIFVESSLPKVGDRIIVQGWSYLRVTVDRVEQDLDTPNIAIYLDWGEHGKSRVWAHDEGKIWSRYNNVN